MKQSLQHNVEQHSTKNLMEKVKLAKAKAIDNIHNEHTEPSLFVSPLTPKGRRPFFGPFLKFGQAIVNAIFVQKI
jgi:hypothetical protein